MLDFQSVGNNIRVLRTESGYSQDYIAELLGVSHQAVSRWEKGLAAPTIDNLAELCELFNVSFENLLCLNKEIEFDKEDIFEGHSRLFVIKRITSGETDYDVVKNFHRFFPSERLLILKSVKEGKLKVNENRLIEKLDANERNFLKVRN